uniref:Uncharacterized protein n=1 Tax=Opuntia streptacantha TaxID=393608 RepID=A0A7C9B1D7_OPUST
MCWKQNIFHILLSLRHKLGVGQASCGVVCGVCVGLLRKVLAGRLGVENAFALGMIGGYLGPLLCKWWCQSLRRAHLNGCMGPLIESKVARMSTWSEVPRCCVILSCRAICCVILSLSYSSLSVKRGPGTN